MRLVTGVQGYVVYVHFGMSVAAAFSLPSFFPFPKTRRGSAIGDGLGDSMISPRREWICPDN
jgi:hypothetical protein